MAVIKMRNGDKWEYVYCNIGHPVSNIPEFTESDNGKVLTVVNGMLTWAEATNDDIVSDIPDATEVYF